MVVVPDVEPPELDVPGLVPLVVLPEPDEVVPLDPVPDELVVPLPVPEPLEVVWPEEPVPVELDPLGLEPLELPLVDVLELDWPGTSTPAGSVTPSVGVSVVLLVEPAGGEAALPPVEELEPAPVLPPAPVRL